MVQMMLVRLNSRAGLYSVFRLLSHSALVLPNSWCAREEAISVYTTRCLSALSVFVNSAVGCRGLTVTTWEVQCRIKMCELLLLDEGEYREAGNEVAGLLVCCFVVLGSEYNLFSSPKQSFSTKWITLAAVQAFSGQFTPPALYY